MMHRLFFIFFTVFFSFSFYAQEIDVQVSNLNPKVGEPFEIIYTVRANRYSQLSFPDFKPLRIIGRATNKMQINNRKEDSFVFTLLADKQATYRIPPASVTIGNKRYNSKSVQIKVGLGETKTRETGDPKAPFLALAIEASKDKVYLGEPIEISYVLYANTLGKYSFGDQYMPPPQNALIYEKIEYSQRTFKPAVFKGKSLSKIDLVKLIVQPTQVGELIIPDAALLVQLDKNPEQNPVDDPFAFLFGNIFEDQIIRKHLRAEALHIPVLSLPQQNVPVDFKGAIGQFSIEVSAFDTLGKIGESLPVKILLSGSGNINLLSDFIFNTGTDWETFSPQITKNINDSTGIPIGKIEFVFSLIPKKAGQLLIPAQRFSFFNPHTGNYETLNSEAIPVFVNESDKPAPSPSISTNTAPAFKKPKGISFAFLLSIIGGSILLALLFFFRKKIGTKKIKKSPFSVEKFRKKWENIQSLQGVDVYTKMERWLLDFVKEKYGLNEFYAQVDKRNYLLNSGVNLSDADIILRMFEACQDARYAPVSASNREALDTWAKQLLNE